jgi:cobalt-zinc-cadmium resistance protein CzcA
VRERLRQFPEVTVVTSQLGAPDDGTDPEAADNAEFYIGLRPREEWKRFKDKNHLIEAMASSLRSIPGMTTNFSQPIKDNVDEAMAGVKGELAIKLFGPDVFVMDAKAREITQVLRGVRGVRDLDWDHLVGQPQLQIVVDRAAAARHGINVQDVQDVIEAGTKGRVVTQIREGERLFDLAVKVRGDDDPFVNLQRLTVRAASASR